MRALRWVATPTSFAAATACAAAARESSCRDCDGRGCPVQYMYRAMSDRMSPKEVASSWNTSTLMMRRSRSNEWCAEPEGGAARSSEPPRRVRRRSKHMPRTNNSRQHRRRATAAGASAVATAAGASAVVMTALAVRSPAVFGWPRTLSIGLSEPAALPPSEAADERADEEPALATNGTGDGPESGACGGFSLRFQNLGNLISKPSAAAASGQRHVPCRGKGKRFEVDHQNPTRSIISSR